MRQVALDHAVEPGAVESPGQCGQRADRAHPDQGENGTWAKSDDAPAETEYEATQDVVPAPGFLGRNLDGRPVERDLAAKALEQEDAGQPVAMALPMMPNMWKDWK